MTGVVGRKRPRRERETPEFIEMVGRLIRRAGVRVAEADEFELAELVALRDEVEAAIVVAIRGQRRYGRSWQHIGDALGVKRHTAFERYAEKVSA